MHDIKYLYTTMIKIVFALLLFILAGCSDNSSKDISSNVAAVVNGVEITQSEVDFILKKTAPSEINANAAKNLRRRILADLVRTELLAQKARDMRLDKTSDFEMIRHISQRQLLASQAEVQLLAKVSRVTPEQVQQVVENNPRYFSDRKLYVYEEVVFPGVNEQLLKNLSDMSGKGATLEQIVERLKQDKIDFRISKKEMTSEQIEPNLLMIFEKIKTNNPQIIRVQNKLSVVLMITSVMPAPVKGENALRAARGLIEAQQRRGVISKEINDMVNRSTIKYFGEYSAKYIEKQDIGVLPVPDQKKAAIETYKTAGLVSILSLTFISAMMMLSSSMRILRGDVWLPSLMFSSKKEEDKNLYTQPYQAYTIHKIYILFISMVVVISLGSELYILRNAIPVWLTFVGIAIGLVIGFAMTRIFALNSLRNLSQRIILLLPLMFSLPILFCVMILKRLAHI